VFRVDRGTDPPLPLPPVRQVPGQLRLTAYAATHVGRRISNEDAFLCRLDPPAPDWVQAVLVVADGIGGRGNGQVASSLAVRAVRDHIVGASVPYSPDAARDLVLASFREANRLVWETSNTDPLLAEMGTTLTVGVVGQRTLHVASLGDSRAYLHRGRRLVRLTRDDWVRASDEPGLPEDLAVPNVTFVTKAVGWDEDPDPQYMELEVGADDILLFCSDGLWDAISERHIEESIHGGRNNLEATVVRMLERASKAQEADNVTVVLVRVDRK